MVDLVGCPSLNPIGRQNLEVDRAEVSSWNTPLVVEHKGRTQVILNGTNRIRSYDLESGKEIWECGGMTVNAIPSVVTVRRSSTPIEERGAFQTVVRGRSFFRRSSCCGATKGVHRNNERNDVGLCREANHSAH